MTPSSSARRLLRRLRAGGIRSLAGAIWLRLRPVRAQVSGTVAAVVQAGHGLEIGGPSRVFRRRGVLPVYPCVARVDNVNFASHTAWEEGLREGGSFVFDPPRSPGTQWICEAHALTKIPNETYDFVLSSHCLEHLANPLAALREWWRVVRPGGHALVIVPDPAQSFDHRRPITTLEHLRADAARRTGEDDTTHVAEVLACHDLSRDPGAGDREAFVRRVARNAENRCLHHHVFDRDLLAAALGESGWRVLATELVRPVHIVAWARKEPS